MVGCDANRTWARKPCTLTFELVCRQRERTGSKAARGISDPPGLTPRDIDLIAGAKNLYELIANAPGRGQSRESLLHLSCSIIVT